MTQLHLHTCLQVVQRGFFLNLSSQLQHFGWLEEAADDHQQVYILNPKTINSDCELVLRITHSICMIELDYNQYYLFFFGHWVSFISNITTLENQKNKPFFYKEKKRFVSDTFKVPFSKTIKIPNKDN